MGKRKCKLEIGKFYHAYGGKPHPAQIYKKTSHGTYVSVKTGTTNGPDMIPIKPTQKGISQSYVKKRPFEGTRKDYGDHEVIGVSFHPDDQEIIEDVKKSPGLQSAPGIDTNKK